jgi:seryl-tRNA synthetase
LCNEDYLGKELEKQAWGIMMGAHYKWEKNYGDSLREQMEWHFFDLNNDDVKAMIEEEAHRRVKENWDNVLSLETSLNEYLKDCADDGVSREELVEEYERLRGEILEDLEDEKVAVEEDLRRLYSSFFNAPERLTVVYQEVVQGGDGR